MFRIRAVIRFVKLWTTNQCLCVLWCVYL